MAKGVKSGQQRSDDHIHGYSHLNDSIEGKALFGAAGRVKCNAKEDTQTECKDTSKPNAAPSATAPSKRRA